jgi:arabinose-5-phosphate isomerase
MMPRQQILDFARAILHDEARALDALADSLDGPFEEAVRLILGCKGKLIVSGLGKSGHVARKIAATFASTGTTATFLHLAEAIHGDLGMASAGDVAILISQSGETGAGTRHRPLPAGWDAHRRNHRECGLDARRGSIGGPRSSPLA